MPDQRDIPNGITPPLGRDGLQWTIGTHRISDSQWLADMPDEADQLAEKAALHASKYDEVVVELAGQDDAWSELLGVLTTWLTIHRGHRYRIDAHRILTDSRLCRELDLDGQRPAELVGRLVAEDFAIMRCVQGDWVMTAATVCFTSRWRLASKLGRNLAQIHSPVPGYRDRLESAVDQFFTRTAASQELTARTSWTLTNSKTRHETAGPAVPVALADLRYVRMEQQTFRVLPRSGAIAFGIATSIMPIEQLREADTRRFREAVARSSKAIREYKGWRAD